MKPRIPPPAIAVFALLLMWLLDRFLPLARWIAPPWSDIGVLCAALGFAIGATAMMSFRRLGTTINPMDLGKSSGLMTGGIFRITRNPMYLGLALMLVGWAIWLGGASPWIVPPLFVAYITVAQIAPEEHALTQRFGGEYLAYQKRVRRWLGWRGR